MRPLTTRKDSSSRRLRAAGLGLGLFILGVCGLVTASGASLGGLNSSSPVADARAVASCDVDGVNLDYVASYDSVTGQFEVNAVVVGGLAPGCSGKTLHVSLAGSGGASLATGTAAVSGPSQAVTMTPTAAAELVVGAAVVVTG